MTLYTDGIMNEYPTINNSKEELLSIIYKQFHKIDQLNSIVNLQSKENTELKEQINSLKDNLSLSEKNNSLLAKELSLCTTKKNSSNSSIPPSQDPYRIKRTESLRNRTGRNPGGQPGHEGTTLKVVSDPTEIIKHQPDYCQCCGNDLSNTSTSYM